MRELFAIIAIFVAFTASAAESEAQKRARLELERELSSMVKIPPPFAHVQYFGFDEGAFEVTEVEFLLDGKALPKPMPAALKDFGANTIFKGEVSHGTHELIAQVSYTDGSSMMFSENAGYTWALKTKVTFTAQRGLETRILLTPSRDASKERNKQFALTSKVTPIMIAQLDDGTIVEKKKAPEPEAAAPPVVDAGEPTAAVVAEVAPEVKAVAAEEKKVAVEDTKLAVFRPAPTRTPVKKEQQEEAVLTPPPMVQVEEAVAVADGSAHNPGGDKEGTHEVIAVKASDDSSAPWLVLGLVGGVAAIGALLFAARRRANRFDKIDP